MGGVGPEQWPPGFSSSAFHGKPVFAQLVKKFLAYIETEDSVPYSQEPTTGACPEPYE
jgi:hypothetical protein